MKVRFRYLCDKNVPPKLKERFCRSVINSLCCMWQSVGEPRILIMFKQMKVLEMNAEMDVWAY